MKMTDVYRSNSWDEGPMSKGLYKREEPKNIAIVDGHQNKSHNNADNGVADDVKEKKESAKMVGVFEVFRFSDWKDRLMMFVGSLSAIITGAALPAVIIVFGDIIALFVNTGKLRIFLTHNIASFLAAHGLTTEAVIRDPTLLVNPTTCAQLAATAPPYTCDDVPKTEGLLDAMVDRSVYFCYIGGLVWLTGYLKVVTWTIAAERQAHRIRKLFLSNVLRQDIGWFDTHEAGELNTRLSDDIQRIQEGIGDKVGTALVWFSTFLTGFGTGFYFGWQLSLVLLAACPLLALSISLLTKLTASITKKELQAYAKAGSVAEEVIGAIRTVVAFGGQEKEVDRYAKNLREAEAYGVKKSLSNGVSLGTIHLCIYCIYALGFWYGGKLTRDKPDEYAVDNMLIVFFNVLMGAMSIGKAATSIQDISIARGAAYTIFHLIDQKSLIDSSSEEGERPASITGNIQFRNIQFSYPSRPDVKILKGMSLEVLPGQTVALVGASGCGKSTTVALIQRFYDPLEGQVLLDGKDIKDLNITWLRKHIGLVAQEPVLFATTIAENIRYGREDVTMEDIKRATKNANAYDFIMNLPQKFETLVGERGAQLSGGQKQRVAIARALVRDPKILLLDEATSALDTESESIVQDALDKARKGRTTLVIAHRLSTIKTADVICGVDGGVVAEKGTHRDLMSRNGIYHQLVTNQSRSTEDDDQSVEKVEQFALKTPATSRTASTVGQCERGKDLAASLPKAPFSRIMKMNAPEWHFISLGCFSAIFNGALSPAFSVLFSQILDVYSRDVDEQVKQFTIYSLIFVGMGVLSFFTYLSQEYFFGKSGSKLTTRIRVASLRSMVRQDIGWYDDPSHSVGALTVQLATDASLVQGAAGVRLGVFIMSVTNMGTAVVIAIVYGYKLGLVILAFMPFIVLAGFVEVKVSKGQAGKSKEALEEAGKVAMQSIENVRTVAALSKEGTFLGLYMDQLRRPYKSAMKKAHLSGFTYGFSQSIIYFAYATSFVFGAHLIEEGEMTYSDVFLVFGAIIFGAMGLGSAMAMAPDAGKAKTSARKIVQLLDTQPAIDYTNEDGTKLLDDYKAEVKFKSCEFSYPSRPTVKVLQGMSFSVSPGHTLALVGSSGCGKSTSVALIERFYDVERGSVCIDNHDVKTLNLQWLRSQIGIVSQEPTLFDRSIAENIAYGDNSREVDMDEIMEAARGANIHRFISELPNGYQTIVGANGIQLSGGQKQRVAIARALVRKPKILLLDEATSALDTESEKVVQEALDKARRGRTCVVIAHRMSTIQGADKICVVGKGQVTEEGTHSQLMARQGFYFKLVKNSVRA